MRFIHKQSFHILICLQRFMILFVSPPQLLVFPKLSQSLFFGFPQFFHNVRVSLYTFFSMHTLHPSTVFLGLDKFLQSSPIFLSTSFCVVSSRDVDNYFLIFQTPHEQSHHFSLSCSVGFNKLHESTVSSVISKT